MIKAFAHELIFGWFGVLEANLLRGAHCCIEMEIAARHVLRLQKLCRDIGRGIDGKSLCIHYCLADVAMSQATNLAFLCLKFRRL